MTKSITQILSPDLPAIADEVAASFKKRHPDWETRFPSAPLEALATSSLEWTFRCMTQSSLDTLNLYLADLFRDNQTPGRELGEVVELFILGKAALFAALRRSVSDTTELFRLQDDLETFYIDVFARISEQYTKLLLLRQEREHARARILLRASRAVSSSLAPDEVLEQLARILAETVDDGCCSIFMRNAENDGLTPQAGWGYDSETCMLSARGLRFCTEGSDLYAPGTERVLVCVL